MQKDYLQFGQAFPPPPQKKASSALSQAEKFRISVWRQAKLLVCQGLPQVSVGLVSLFVWELLSSGLSIWRRISKLQHSSYFLSQNPLSPLIPSALPKQNQLRYPFNRRLSSPHIRSGRSGGEQRLFPCKEETLDFPAFSLTGVPNKFFKLPAEMQEKLKILAARSQVWVCSRSLIAIAGSNPSGVTAGCFLWVLSGRDLRDGPIPRAEESYQLCVSLSVIR